LGGKSSTRASLFSLDTRSGTTQEKQPAFQNAFSCKAGSASVRPTGKRCAVWLQRAGGGMPPAG